MVLARHIVAFNNLYFSVFESLVIEILLGENLGTVHHVRCYLCTFEESEAFLEVDAFRLLDAHIVDGGHTGAETEAYVYVCLVVYERIDSHRHVGEESVTPVMLHGVGDFVAREFHLLTYGKS